MHNFLFGIYPYIALSVLFLGSIVRYERDPFTWKSSSSQLLRRKQLVMGSVLFHVGVLIIFLGHFFGLLVPLGLYEALGVGHTFKQLLAMVAGGAAGVFALAGISMLLHRRLTDARIRVTSSFADIAILVLLLAQLLLGMGTIPISAQHLDGGEMVTFMAWANGIITFDLDASSHIEHAHWIFKTHLFLGLTIFLVFPFTRLVHMLSAPVRFVFRPGYQIVRSRRVSR